MSSPEWVPGVTREAMARILEHAGKVGLSNTEEFTFRSFFMAAAADALASPRFQTEWHNFDLLVQASGEATLIEFKYYLVRRTYSLQGVPGKRKGGPGPKNESEFDACLHKLRSIAVHSINHRRLVLVYQREEGQVATTSFHQSYNEIGPSSSISAVWPVPIGPLEARVLQPAALAATSTLH